ncbi:MAG: hypothetical protein J1E34_05460 [Oscillospiraceae bacterium]|nr:hypothetical protein [Oscillospiraceae bacterium]
MDIKELLSKIHIASGLDPDFRLAANAGELKDGKTMLNLKRFSEKHSLEGEIAAKLFCLNSGDKNIGFNIGAEILRDCYGKVNYFVAPVFNADIFNSTAAILKAYRKDIRITAVCSGSLPDGTDLSVIDETMNISEADANIYKTEISNTEQISIGSLSASAVKAAMDISKKICDKHARIVVLFPDAEK